MYRDGNAIYKRQPKFLADNAIWCFEQMYPSGYVPHAVRIDDETIRTEYIAHEPVTDADAFMAHFQPVLDALQAAGIRHGDLTEYSVLVQNNRPMLIDFAESRLWDDPRPDKRREGDRYWLWQTMNKLSTAL